ncbi:MAG: N-acetylglucosamine-6-phosphate deacetylase [Acidimicrobiales bacterium]
MLIGNVRLVTPDAVIPEAWLHIKGSAVAATGAGPAPGEADVELDGHYVVPGFVDLHCHGGGGSSYASGSAEAILHAAEFHRLRGTTTTLASLLSAGREELAAQVRVLAECTRAAVVAGCHLEGPYLSRRRCGAHEASALRDPDIGELEGLLRAGDGTIAMVTIAAERPHALEAISWLADRGVVPAIGHTDATFDQTLAALAAGARVATHLGNAIRPLHHREPGPLLALLSDERVVCELIADGVHLHPGFATFVTQIAGPGRVAMVSDATAAAGLPDGEFRLGTVAVVVGGGQARVKESGALAGSTLTLDAAFRRAVKEYGLSLPAAVRTTSTTPAAVLGRSDIGHLREGARADLVVLDDDLMVQGVMAGGAWVCGPAPGRDQQVTAPPTAGP